MTLRRLVLDVLKPLKEPSIVELTERLERVRGVEAVNVTVNEVDVETMGLIITIEGNGIDFEAVKEVLEDCGAVIHSVDQVVAGSRIIETPRLASEG